jgi:hypothetical protein
VPFGWLLPLSLQTAVPVEQLSVPVWQGLLIGVQAVPAVQVPQLPLLHTMFGPHDVPFGWFPSSAQTGDPVVHDVVPVLHGLFIGWQEVPAEHITQAPALHTLSVPQIVPFAMD